MKKMKKTNKTVVCILLIACALFLYLPYEYLLAENIQVKEAKTYCKLTIEDDFSENAILVVLNNATSKKSKSFSASDFPEVDCKEVVDLTYPLVAKIKSSLNPKNFPR